MINSALHGKPRHPYYVFAPDYRETSSGICVLHYLCHALNLAGYEAYVSQCVTNPNLRTPILTDEVRQHHQAIGLAPIAVYPEVLDGNPLGTPIVARYILNREGFLTGRTIDAQDSDLFFYYTQDFGADANSDDLLLLPIIDSELFSPPLEPVERSGHYLYLNRIDRSLVDLSLLPSDVQILSLANPKSLAELAEIFRTASVLYSYEISATCTEAMLCGCPVIYLPGGHVKSQPFTEQFGNAGSALYDEPGGLERARATVMQARARWLDIEKAFWPQLQRFLDITQRAAVQYVCDHRVPSVKDWLRQRQTTPAQQRLVDARRQALRGQTSLTVLVRDKHGEARALDDTLESLAWWRSSSSIDLRTIVLSTTATPTRADQDTHWLHVSSPGAIELNEVLQGDDSDWLLLLDAGDEILPSGALLLDLELAGAQNCRMIYCDGMFRSAEGPGAALRPGVNLDYLLSLPLVMASHWLVRRSLAVQAGGYDATLPDALSLDLVLRLIDIGGLDGIAHLEEPLVVSDLPVVVENQDEREAVLRHLANRGYAQAEIVENPPRHYHVKYRHAHQPLVSILIPTRDQLPLLRRCIESLLEKTRYPHFEIILIDNDSQLPETLEWLQLMANIAASKLSVLNHPGPFNFSAMNNLAACHARGEYLLLLNNDVAILNDDWLDELLNHAQRPEVGIVGAKLLTPTGHVQHAGLIGGLNGPAGSPNADQAAHDGGYLQRLLVDQNVSAVSASCLMIRKEVYEAVTGMDEAHFQLTCNDLDLCLKVGELGYLNVWTPHALLLHEGGATWSEARKDARLRQRFAQEQHHAQKKWLTTLANDPTYNKNFALRGTGYSFEALHDLTWKPLCWRPLPVVLAYAALDEQVASERLKPVFGALRDAGLIDGCLSTRALSPVEVERLRPDVIVIQHQNDRRRLKLISQGVELSQAFKVLEVSGPIAGLGAGAASTSMELEILTQAMRLVDRVVVPTQAMADALAHMHPDIRVIGTRLDARWASLPSPANLDGKVRVGCGFSARHPRTSQLAENLVRRFADQVDWILWGDVPHHLHGCAREIHPGNVQYTPRMLASLNLNTALALRADDPAEQFNDALPLLQFAACGHAVICSDVESFQVDLDVMHVRNELDAWAQMLERHLGDTRDHIRKPEQIGLLDESHLQDWQLAWSPN
ncbi:MULTISPECIES: glycosyltransferase family 2 protein [unclassified Pseudomonas]|jgi:GT2 family glycosyltransferase|uniref:glycosyltransferase family 2 protein n=1 Tax=unclassified Pseudomonas TaxID=196821 RepID=UPI001E500D87|nr:MULTISPECIES: glycosyltransferase family 2 protein [unclassified Pseudomonas]MCE0916337.1 glycosyltransferase family 2 protein [Pseudomonas sp. NMI760_13]MCP8632363.1 glycosyltransferase family 2 protein [Pseudomonas sp. DVZ6]MDC0688244.1 glycosyltransferase family 2 protein [Mitsuaria sp. RG]MDD7782481.1 glycosyltransferase family 2 protein [Pseudomonas sp. DVZ24]